MSARSLAGGLPLLVVLRCRIGMANCTRTKTSGLFIFFIKTSLTIVGQYVGGSAFLDDLSSIHQQDSFTMPNAVQLMGDVDSCFSLNDNNNTAIMTTFRSRTSTSLSCLEYCSSRLPVHSSRITMSRFCRTALTRTMSCFSPSERLLPSTG